MNKKTKFKLNETLDKALSPPKKNRNLKALDSLLQQFDDGKEIIPNLDQTQTKVRPAPNPDLTQTVGNPNPDQTQTTKKNNSYIESGKKNNVHYQSKSSSVSPVRDFNKRANSLERDALPKGMFPGASKAIYDALYIKTIGSIESKKMVQATRKELMDWSGIKNIKTINTHLKRLKDTGLVKVTNFVGEQKGSFYEVFLPEETQTPNPDPTQTRAKPNLDQKMVLDPDQKMVWVGLGKTTENKDTYETAKTSLKTLKNDDDEKSKIFNEIIKRFEAVSKKLTGKGLKSSEAQRWTEIADLLVMELELAAARTESISSVPAFLKEVLRRKLETKTIQPKRPAQKGVSKFLQVGKPAAEKTADSGEWETEFLSDEEKQKTLLIMRERIKEGHQELVISMEATYTPEDWEWLMNNLEQGS